MAGPLGRRPHLLGAQPDRRRSRDGFAARRASAASSTCSTCSRTRAAPASTSATRSATSAPTSTPASCACSGYNVLHAMGYDAFGLPAEQYAVQTGQHPRVTTEANIANMRRQLRALGLGHDPRRGVATTDVEYYRWTQWIFLQIFNSWYDDDAGPRPADRRARSPSSRPARREPESDANPDALPWARPRRRRAARGRRLVPARVPRRGARQLVPGARHRARQRRGHRRRPQRPRQPPGVPPPAEAVDAAHHRVRRPPARRPRPARLARVDQADAAQLDRPQRRRRRRVPGRGARAASSIEVFTTRPDTLFGATYMVLAPEHPLVDVIVPDRVARRRRLADIPQWRGIFGLDKLPVRGGARRTASSRRRSPSSSARPRAARRPACSPARSPRTPPTAGTSRSSSPTTC